MAEAPGTAWTVSPLPLLLPTSPFPNLSLALPGIAPQRSVQSVRCPSPLPALDYSLIPLPPLGQPSALRRLPRTQIPAVSEECGASVSLYSPTLPSPPLLTPDNTPSHWSSPAARRSFCVACLSCHGYSAGAQCVRVSATPKNRNIIWYCALYPRLCMAPSLTTQHRQNKFLQRLAIAFKSAWRSVAWRGFPQRGVT